MVLKSSDGLEFQLRIVGYEFPGIPEPDPDSDWLLVAIRVVTPAGVGTSVPPCLTIWEAEDLAEWLADIGRGKRVESPERIFVEPNLYFRLIRRAANRVVLGVHYSLEDRRQWQPSRPGAQPEWGARLELDLRPEDIAMAAASLRADLRRFPPRGYGRSAPRR